MTTKAPSQPAQTHRDTCGITPNAAIDALRAMRKPCEAGKAPTLREIGKRLGINPGYLSNILLGKKQPSEKVYRALGLNPPVRVMAISEGYDIAPVCQRCGVVHTTKRCVAGKRKGRRIPFKVNGVRHYRHAGTDQI